MNRLTRALLLTTWFLTLTTLSGFASNITDATSQDFIHVATEYDAEFCSLSENDTQVLNEQQDKHLPVEQEKQEENEESRETCESKEKQSAGCFSFNLYLSDTPLRRFHSFTAHAQTANSVKKHPLYLQFHQWKDDVCG